MKINIDIDRLQSPPRRTSIGRYDLIVPALYDGVRFRDTV